LKRLFLLEKGSMTEQLIKRDWSNINWKADGGVKKLARLHISKEILEKNAEFLYMIREGDRLVKAVVRIVQVGSDKESAEVEIIRWASKARLKRYTVGGRFICRCNMLFKLNEEESKETKHANT
jgi:hypothetical protein